MRGDIEQNLTGQNICVHSIVLYESEQLISSTVFSVPHIISYYSSISPLLLQCSLPSVCLPYFLFQKISLTFFCTISPKCRPVRIHTLSAYVALSLSYIDSSLFLLLSVGNNAQEWVRRVWSGATLLLRDVRNFLLHTLTDTHTLIQK